MVIIVALLVLGALFMVPSIRTKATLMVCGLALCIPFYMAATTSHSPAFVAEISDYDLIVVTPDGNAWDVEVEDPENYYIDQMVTLVFNNNNTEEIYDDIIVDMLPFCFNSDYLYLYA